MSGSARTSGFMTAPEQREFLHFTSLYICFNRLLCFSVVFLKYADKFAFSLLLLTNLLPILRWRGYVVFVCFCVSLSLSLSTTKSTGKLLMNFSVIFGRVWPWDKTIQLYMLAWSLWSGFGLGICLLLTLQNINVIISGKWSALGIMLYLYNSVTFLWVIDFWGAFCHLCRRFVYCDLC